MRRWAFRLAFAAVCVLVVAAGLYKASKLRDWQLCGRLVTRVETAQRVVALTFDDGPVEGAVDELIATLGSRHVPATFFVIGGDLAGSPEAGRRLVAAGHELGNHTYSHRRMVLKSPGFIRREIEETDALIRAAGQRGPIVFRAPYCKKLVGLPWYLWRTGRTHVTWDVEPDSNARVAGSAERIAARVLEGTRPGSIILLHVWYGHPPARAAIPLIVDGLHAKGYRFVTISELLALDERQQPAPS